MNSTVGEVLDTLYVYDSVDDEWGLREEKMIYPRKFANGCYLNGDIYIIGGIGNDGHLVSKMEYYSLLHNRFYPYPDDMLIPKSNFALGSFSDVISFVIYGGITANGNTNGTEEFFVLNGQWNILDDGMMALSDSAALAVDGSNEFYVFGGKNAQNVATNLAYLYCAYHNVTRTTTTSTTTRGPTTTSLKPTTTTPRPTTTTTTTTTTSTTTTLPTTTTTTTTTTPKTTSTTTSTTTTTTTTPKPTTTTLPRTTTHPVTTKRVNVTTHKLFTTTTHKVTPTVPGEVLTQTQQLLIGFGMCSLLGGIVIIIFCICKTRKSDTATINDDTEKN